MDKLPIDLLREGCALLDPILNSHGFTFELGGAGSGSGGPFAFGYYISGDRKLELHYRYSLGMVTYYFGDTFMDHESYMRALLGPAGGNRYPGFSDEKLAAFEGLKFDLEHFGSAFLFGDQKEFARCASAANEWQRKSGIARLA